MRLYFSILVSIFFVCYSTGAERGPRIYYEETTLVEGGEALCVVVYPEDPEYAGLAENIVAAIKDTAGIKIHLKSDKAYSEQDQFLHVICIGNTVNNRLMMDLYMLGLVPEQPGAAPLTITDPWSKGRNVIVLGGRDLQVSRLTVQAFLDAVRASLPRKAPRRATSFPPQAIKDLKVCFRDTTLVADGETGCMIIHPDGPEYVAVAMDVAEAIKKASGSEISVKNEKDYSKTDREFHLICLGRMNNNRLALDLYIWRYVVSDDWFPGPDGYELRTVSDPWGNGKNVIMLGGSDLESVFAASLRFKEMLPEGSSLVFPYTIETRFRGSENLETFMQGDVVRFRELFRNEQRLGASKGDGGVVIEPGYSMLSCAAMYYLTGCDEYAVAWAAMARDWMNSYYTFSRFRQLSWTKYTMSHILRSFDLVEESPAVSDDLKLEITNLIFDNVSRRAVGTDVNMLRVAGHFIRVAMHGDHKSVPYGYDYFSKYYPASDLERLETGMQAVRVGHETVANAGGFLERHGGYTVSYAVTPMMLALALDDHTHFNTGAARDWMRYALAGINSSGVPFFGRGRGRISSFPIASWYYDEPEYLWGMNMVLNSHDHHPDMTETAFDYWLWSYAPKIEPVRPSAFLGVQSVPLNKANYVHIRYDSRKPVDVPPERTFHYLTMRERFQGGQYMLVYGINDGIIGMRGGDGNAVHGTPRQNIDGTPAAHNTALIVRKDDDSGSAPALCDLQLISDIARTGFSRSVLHNYNFIDWARNIVWIKARYWVVFDQFKARESGEYDLRTQWYWGRAGSLPQPDSLNRFSGYGKTIQFAGDDFNHALGRFKGYSFLQQVFTGAMEAGEQRDFANLYYPSDGSGLYTVSRVADGRVMVAEPGRQVLVGVAPLSAGVISPGTAAHNMEILPGLRAECVMFSVAHDEMSFAGLLKLEVNGASVESDVPVDMSVDMKEGVITIYAEDPAEIQIKGFMPVSGAGSGSTMDVWETRRAASFETGERSPFGGPEKIRSALAELARYPEEIKALKSAVVEASDDDESRMSAGSAIWGTPLHWAAYMGRADAVRHLTQQGSDVNALDNVGRTPLHRAAAMGHDRVIALLLEAGADVNARGADGATPLHWAVYLTARSGPETVALLLKNGADPNIARFNGVTPLHFASALDRRDLNAVIEMLLEYGADIEGRDRWDRTPLLRAVFGRGDPEFLLEKGADIHVRDRDGRVVLHWAAAADNATFIKLLLQKGLDVDVRDGRGRTPLHWAVAVGHVESAQLLLEHGADQSATDNSGKTPADLLKALPVEPVEKRGGVGEYQKIAEFFN